MARWAMCDSYPVPVALKSAWLQASQPDFFRPTGDARCCWRWGAKYLRQAGTCPSCLARCDASVEGAAATPLGTRLRASWEVVGWRWRNGEGSSCSRFFPAAFSSVSLLRLSAPPSTHSTGTINYVSIHTLNVFYCTVKAQHSSLCTPPRRRYRGK